MEVLRLSDKPKILGYHSHIYFDLACLNTALDLWKEMSSISVPGRSRVGKFHDRPIGPHTKPMFTVIIGTEGFNEVVPYLMLNRRGMDVLVHPETGNDLLDHTEHALWLGNKVLLDLDKL